MTNFEEQGYLADDAGEISQIIQKLWSSYFDVSLEANALAHLLVKDETFYADNLQHVLAVGLILRLMEGHQSLHLLCQRGLTVAAKVLLRSNVEALIVLKYICRSVENLNRYVATDQLQRRKLMKVVLNDKSGAFSDELRNDITEELLASMDNSIASLGATELKLEELSKSVGLHQLYQTAYRVLSYDVHILPRSIEKYWILDEKENFIAYNFTPREDDIPGIVVQSSAALLNAVDTLAILLGKQNNYTDRISELFDKLK